MKRPMPRSPAEQAAIDERRRAAGAQIYRGTRPVGVPERISPERLNWARRRLKRHTASVLIACMAESDVDFATIDKRLGWKLGGAKAWLVGLIECETRELDLLSDIALALGHELRFTAIYAMPVRLPAELSKPEPAKDKP